MLAFYLHFSLILSSLVEKRNWFLVCIDYWAPHLPKHLTFESLSFILLFNLNRSWPCSWTDWWEPRQWLQPKPAWDIELYAVYHDGVWGIFKGLTVKLLHRHWTVGTIPCTNPSFLSQYKHWLWYSSSCSCTFLYTLFCIVCGKNSN